MVGFLPTLLKILFVWLKTRLSALIKRFVQSRFILIYNLLRRSNLYFPGKAEYPAEECGAYGNLYLCHKTVIARLCKYIFSKAVDNYLHHIRGTFQAHGFHFAVIHCNNAFEIGDRLKVRRLFYRWNIRRFCFRNTVNTELYDFFVPFGISEDIISVIVSEHCIMGELINAAVMLIHLFLFSRVFYVFESNVFTVIDCLMNQINGIVERSAVAFHSAVHIKVSV